MAKHISPIRLVSLMLCIVSFVSHAQHKQTQLDSLLSVLGQTKNENSEKTILLRDKIGRLYKQRSLRQAKEFAEKTLALAKQIDSPNARAVAFNLVGDMASLTGDFKKGAAYADSNQMFRCHKSYLININHVKKFEGGDNMRVLLKSNITAEVSIRKKAEFFREA